MRPNTLLLSLFIVVISCSPATMQLNSTLQQHASQYEVKGRQGWLINQQLSFGPYLSGKVKRGWTFSYDIPFLIRFQGAREKLQFTLQKEDQRAEVFCLGQATTQDFPILDELFAVSLQDKEVFSGVIVTSFSDKPWHYLLQKNYNKLPGRNFNGIIQQDNNQIEIREIQHTASGTKSLGEPLGYEFSLNAEVLGAVETVNKGKVILRDDVAEELKMVMAASASAVLLRSSLQDTPTAL